jgi:hypothetical protein
MNVIHLKAVKPINEYFDAVTVSWYRAGSINGIDHYNHEQLVEFVTFFESITINA